MVISAENPRQPPDPMAARVPPRPPPRRAERQSQLHNFSFPILKKWGSQRVLRCLNVNRKGELIQSESPSSNPISRSEAPEPERDDDGALEQVREKLLVHLREAADRVKLPEPKSPPPESAPWNLRTRKAVVRAPSESPSPPPPQAAGSREERGGAAGTHTRTVRLRSEDVEKKERPRFSISLTREEIDEDIYALTGSRARRRPKKRPRALQKQLDMLSPGSWLTEITADSYKVPD